MIVDAHCFAGANTVYMIPGSRTTWCQSQFFRSGSTVRSVAHAWTPGQPGALGYRVDEHGWIEGKVIAADSDVVSRGPST
jgi:hypothetical protein